MAWDWGALIPNQAAAVAGVLLWWLMIEPALGSLVPVINSFGTVGSSAALATAPNFGDLPMWAGGLVAAAWVAIALCVGIRLAVRRAVA